MVAGHLQIKKRLLLRRSQLEQRRKETNKMDSPWTSRKRK